MIALIVKDLQFDMHYNTVQRLYYNVSKPKASIGPVCSTSLFSPQRNTSYVDAGRLSVLPLPQKSPDRYTGTQVYSLVTSASHVVELVLRIATSDQKPPRIIHTKKEYTCTQILDLKVLKHVIT